MSLRLPSFVPLALAVLLAACGAPPPSPDPEPGPETCNNGKDDNGDGKTDCADPKCFSDSACTAGAEVCGNAVDDDGDLSTDCEDPDCAADPACQVTPGKENCQNLLDDNADGKVDCADPGCADQACGLGCVCENGQRTEEDCLDGADNDGDGHTDCADFNCIDSLSCMQPNLETSCSDAADNDKDGKTDCADSDCDGQPCGAGCTCVPAGKKETACTDGQDNDGDGQKDCADPDCAGMGPAEVCGDNVDNDCDGAVDCTDPDCSGASGCTSLQDGQPCTVDSQCLGGKCLTEIDSGNPGGMCSNAVSCDATNQTGCNGGVCVENGSFDVCMPQCQGNTGCRKGYACLDPDGDASTTDSYCIGLCTSDSDCTATGQGANYGCNPWSAYCESKDKGFGKFGAPCSTHSQCESYWCSTDKPGGYCLGVCDAQAQVCGGDGVCVLDGDGDGVAQCADGCSSSADCRGSPYSCQSSADGNICWCLELFAPCSTDSQCCSGICNGLYCSLF